MRSDSSVVASQVKHVGGVRCSSFLFVIPKVYCFFWCVFEFCAERHIVVNHQPLLHPDPTFVGFLRGHIQSLFQAQAERL